MLKSLLATRSSLALAACLCALWPVRVQAVTDPLPSWNEGAARTRIVAFVQAVTDRTGKDYVPPGDRIAVFDNDGTLWSEQPLYFQAIFALDTAKAMVRGWSLISVKNDWKTVYLPGQ